jgi:hypothetical protein
LRVWVQERERFGKPYSAAFINETKEKAADAMASAAWSKRERGKT